MNNDPRKDLPSASSFDRYAICPGAFALERTADEGEPTPDAVRGTRIHALLAGQSVEQVHAVAADLPAVFQYVEDEDDSDTVERCRQLEARLIAGTIGLVPHEIVRERRLWLHDEATVAPLFSGKPDAVALVPDNQTALVWDYKTGRGAVSPAENNWQLRTLAVLVRENYDVRELTVAIIQPWGNPAISAAFYNPEDLRIARNVCVQVARRVMSPDQPRVATTGGCRYCRALAICPQARAYFEATAEVAVALRDTGGLALDGASLSRLLDSSELVEEIIEALRLRAKALLREDPDSVPGWQLVEHDGRASIDDVGKLYERMRATYRTEPAAFIAACGMTKKSFKELLKEATRLKGKSLDACVQLNLDGVIKKTEPTLRLERAPA